MTTQDLIGILQQCPPQSEMTVGVLTAYGIDFLTSIRSVKHDGTETKLECPVATDWCLAVAKAVKESN